MPNHRDLRYQVAQISVILLRRGTATEDTIKGCSADEIEEIESDVGQPLPVAYREFLSKMGREAGAFYVGTDMFYPNLLGITEAARDLVREERSDIVLPDDAVVFSMHQGYQFLFVRSGDGDDPPVYYYMEQSGAFVKKAEELTKFLLDVAQDDW